MMRFPELWALHHCPGTEELSQELVLIAHQEYIDFLSELEAGWNAMERPAS